MALTPEQEARYALDYGVDRSELGSKAQDEYDRLKLGWDKQHPALARQRELTRRALESKQPQGIEAIIRKSLGWTRAALLIFLIIAVPDSAAGETNRTLPAWMWLGIGIAVVMLALTALALRINVPRRIAGIMTTNTGGHASDDDRGVFPGRGSPVLDLVITASEPPVNGDQVRGTVFCRVGKMDLVEVPGYDARQVDDLCRRIAAELDAGRSARPAIENATLQRRICRRRYDIDTIDWFLGQFLLPPGRSELSGISDDLWRDLPVAQLAPQRDNGSAKRYPDGRPFRERSRRYFAEQYEHAWRDFGQLPGTRLWWGKVGKLKELRTAEHQTLMSERAYHRTFSTAGRSFTRKPASAKGRSSPAVAELAARIPQDRLGHFATNTDTGKFWRTEAVSALADDTGTPILYAAGRHYLLRAGGCIMFPDQRWLRFPVRGTREPNAIMTAVDQAGDRVARYRIVGKTGGQAPYRWSTSGCPVEIIVHPGWKLTDERALALALSADWLSGYFDRPSG